MRRAGQNTWVGGAPPTGGSVPKAALPGAGAAVGRHQPAGGRAVCGNLKAMWRLVVAILLAGCFLELSAREGDDRIGRPAPALQLKHWLNSAPLDVAALRGKVVLVRWWTDGCDLCVATAPALREFQRKYGPQGLQVIGVFHPKPAGDWDMQRVRRAAERLGFTFPVALDADWAALHRWWLDSNERGFTSVSFLIDKRGVIRYVHPGGEYHLGEHESCQRNYKDIEQTINRLLAE